MGTSSCQTFMAFILKFLNFLQAFVGVAMIIYSAYMLSQWQHRPDEFPSPAPSHDVSGIPSSDDVVNHLNLALSDNALHINFHSLPAPWFIYACMGIGVIICCITCIGNIAAESINGCCLCFIAVDVSAWLEISGASISATENVNDIKTSKLYYILTCEIASLEAVLVCFIDYCISSTGNGLVALVAFDRHWKKDVPFDPTGELDSLMAFIEDNMDMLKSTRMLASIMFTDSVSVLASEKRRGLWNILKSPGNGDLDICINSLKFASLINSEFAVLSLSSAFSKQHLKALSLLFATILRFMVSSRDVDDDIEAEYDYSSREPLLIPRPSQACGSPRGDSDIWSSRMRQKYGLNTGDSKTQFTESKPVH
ncbi:UNVERIFIED_CONTAM: Tetraspanin-18 [Sesamum calycinum]|uniref:Tetraspanin-18 n=1 Tax=Sesamum calycinum TaxID=2727403 RepID=A0AAW2SEN9_9LAMI